MRCTYALLPALMAAALPVFAQNNPFNNLNISAILNGGFTMRSHEAETIGGYPLAEHGHGLPDGFWLEHSELALSSNIDDLFNGKLTLVVDSHDGETELEMEEGFIQTLSLPAGFGVRGGRFLANVGYLNNRHSHSDFFVDRPLPLQAFLGGHYFDDGARVNWVAPTDLYLELGVEAFAGKQLPAASGKRVGSSNFFANLGGDLGSSNSWQLSLSFLQADADPDHCHVHSHGHSHVDAHEAEHSHDHGDDHDHDHGHAGESHSISACAFKGDRELLALAGVWKWAPEGNFKNQSLTLQGEYFRQKEDGEQQHEDHFHPWQQTSTGGYLSAAWQFSQQWTTGVRGSFVKPGDGYGDLRATAYDLMLQYNHSHFSTLRVQYSREKREAGLSDDVVTLQYVMSLGDHSAHTY